MRRPQFRRLKPRLLICSFLIAVGIVLAVLGVMRSVTGKAAQQLPPLIQSVTPVRDAVQVPEQSQVVVDLTQGYTGVLVIDGVELATIDQFDLSAGIQPGEQAAIPLSTVYAEGNATLTFQPTKGAAIESFTQGTHVVKVIYWKLVEGRTAAHSYLWSFTTF
ncbi:MAG: hypothetical protein ABIQ39_09095 [Ilumatobacteraceae bacterium]